MGILELSSSLPFLVFRLRRTRTLFMRTMVKQAWASGAAILLITFLCGNARSATLGEFENAVSSLQAVVEETTTTERNAGNILAETNVLDSALLIGSIEKATPGGTATWNLTFVPGPTPITALQADLLIPPNVSIVSVVTGPDALAAGKSVAFSSGTNRALLFGLNANPIGNGVVAIVTLQLIASTSPGFYPAVMSNPVASDANGNSVPLCLTSGGIEVQ